MPHIARGVELDALTLARPSLEDVYLDLVGEQALADTDTDSDSDSDSEASVR